MFGAPHVWSLLYFGLELTSGPRQEEEPSVSVRGVRIRRGAAPLLDRVATTLP